MSVPVHPVQLSSYRVPNEPCAPQAVTLAAYEVYKHIHGEQPALITGGCRGGFSVGELVALLYARGFSRDEWSMRVDEAFNGLMLQK